MLFINHSSSSQAAKDYFKQELTQAEYYMKDGQQILGEWHGLGAALLGLTGPVDRDSFFRLCDNQHPLTGEQLTARMKANRRISYDFTFDAPKSVTLAFELGGDARILEACQASGYASADSFTAACPATSFGPTSCTARLVPWQMGRPTRSCTFTPWR